MVLPSTEGAQDGFHCVMDLLVERQKERARAERDSEEE